MTTAMQSGLRLFEIPQAMRDILDRAVDPETGEIDAVLEMQLEGLEEDFNRKTEWIALLSREAKVEAAAVKLEEDRLTKRRTALENRETRLKAYLFGCLTRARIERVQGRTVTVRIQDNPPSIRWTGNPEEIPVAYRRITIAPDIAKLKDDLKTGAELPEGFESTVGRSVRIV